MSTFVDQLPAYMNQAAKRLGNALAALDWPSQSDGPGTELNALLSLSYVLSNAEPAFWFYAEAPMAAYVCDDGKTRKGRVDMIGSNGEVALAIEAKSFGNIHHQSLAIRRDFQRLKSFRPLLAKSAIDPRPPEWWDRTPVRYGMIVITSFRGDELAAAWTASDDATSDDHLSGYGRQARRDIEEGEVGFRALRRDFPLPYRGAAPMDVGTQWADTGEGWVLWGLQELPLLDSGKVGLGSSSTTDAVVQS